MGLLLVILLGLCGLAIEEVAPRFPSWTLFAAAATVGIRTPPAPRLHPACTQPATHAPSSQPHASQVITTLLGWLVYSLTTHSLTTHYSLLTHSLLTTGGRDATRLGGAERGQRRALAPRPVGLE